MKRFEHAWGWPLVGVGIISASAAVAACSSSDGADSPAGDAGGDGQGSGPAGDATADGTSPSGNDSGVQNGSDATTGDATTAGDAALDGGNGADGPPDEGGRSEGGAQDAAITWDFDAPTDLSKVGVDCSAAPNAQTGAPSKLACTGLYANFAAKTIAKNVAAYDPGLHLWSDGAEKQRYLSLPPGSKIDTSTMDEWTFPKGTKIWKQFTLQGKKVETRFLHKTGDTGSLSDWVRTTYQWNDAGDDATELTEGAQVPNGSATYTIPSHDVCETCHEGRQDFVLGFEAVSLSTAGATGLPIGVLERQQLLTAPPSAPLKIPGNATEQAALGWLHANCGTTCHNDSQNTLTGARDTGLFLRLKADALGSVRATDTYKTAVGQRVTDSEAADLGRSLPAQQCTFRITRGKADRSCIPWRDGQRDVDDVANLQMPPINTGSHLVDAADVKAVSDWINAMGADY